MSRTGAFGWVLVVLAVVLAATAAYLVLRPAPSSLEPWSADGADPQTYAADLVVETNAARADEGLPALTVSECATTEATERADDLSGGADLEHAGLTPVIEKCPPASTAAENLARAAATPHDVVAAWLDSPGHRANLLDPDLYQVGVGCMLDGDEMLCSQVFLGP
ncbi:CAP domain-containing protein [Cellulomonas sp. Root485]|uniref:CAP domain-containing protein n=1 Tax=Cellulomonas sp. Root485 TaxID=1736546 RepID=UPI00138F4F34|nr:CAP domain-containing protein [Cellulomonas sp. Root485]